MSQAPSRDPGLAGHFRELLVGLLSHLRARLELAGAESRDALTQIAGVLLLAAVALTLTLAGYLLLCLALVFGLAQLFSSTFSWIWIAAALGGLHLLSAWMVLRGARGWLPRWCRAAARGCAAVARRAGGRGCRGAHPLRR